MPEPSPCALWRLADDEHPHDAAARRKRYIELMVEAGHLIVTPPPIEQYTADQPPSHINRHRYGGAADEPPRNVDEPHEAAPHSAQDRGGG